MPNAERRGARRARAAPSPRRKMRAAKRMGLGPIALAVSAGLALCLGPVVSVLGPATLAGAAGASPLGLAIASFAGDSTITPSLTAPAGSDLTFQVTVTNASASTQSDISVPVTVPSSFLFESATLNPSAGTTAVTGGVISWSIPSLAAGAAATITYSETTDAPAAFESDATTASATSDQSITPVTASSSVEVLPATDLSVTVTDGTDIIAPGASDTYTITVTNNGPSETPDATVTQTFSGGFAATGEFDTVGATFTELGGSQFQWTAIDLPSGASATLELTGTVPSSLSGGSTFVSLADITPFPGAVDPNAQFYDIDSDVVAGAAGASPLGLAIASFAGDSTITPSLTAPAGSDLTFQVTVTNASASTQSDISVPVTVPSSFLFESATLNPSAGTTAVTGGVISWSIPSLAAGAAATITYSETTDAPAAFESDATTASATSDQSITPVTASSSVEVLPATDLSVTVTDGTDIIAPGASDTYTITVTNNGPSAVSGSVGLGLAE